jgi:RNA polymerase sigma-70 factor (ECF subfamily)
MLRPIQDGGRVEASKQAFEKLVIPLLGSLQGVARRLCANDAESEDLVAETVARAWRSRESLHDPAAFRGWIFKILHNTFISERRRPDSRLVPIEEDDPESDAGAPFSLFEQMHQPFLLWFSNPEQEFLDKLLREDLERSLAALPEHYRIVVILSDLEELNYAEIATALGIPLGTVRSRLSRARSALQKALWQNAQEYGLAAAKNENIPAPESAKRTSP